MGVKAGEAFVEILADSTKLQQGLKKASAQLKSFGASATRIGLQTAGIGLALASPFILATKVFLSVGDALDKMSRRTGVAVESLSALGFAAEQSGSDLGTLEKGLRTMQRIIFDLELGLSTATDAFDALGLSLKDVQSLKPEDQFKLIADRLSKIEDPTKRAAVAMKVFGRAGTQLLPLLEGGADGIEKFIKQAQDLGLVVTGEESKAAAEFTDEINILRRSFERLLFVAGSAVLPVMKQLRDRFLGVTTTLIDLVNKNKPLLQTFLKMALVAIAVGGAIAALGVGITGVGIVVGAVASIIGGFITIIGLLASGLVFLVTPFGLAIAATVAFGVILARQFNLVSKSIDFLKKTVMRLQSTFGDSFKTMTQLVKAGNLTGAFKILSATLNVIWTKMIGTLQTAWARFRKFIVDAAGKAFLGVFDAINSVVVKIQSSFNDMIIGIALAFSKLKNVVKEIQEVISFDLAAAEIRGGDQTDEQKKQTIEILRARQEAERKAREDQQKQNVINALKLSAIERKEIIKNGEIRKKIAEEIKAIVQAQLGGTDQEVTEANTKAQDDLNKAKMNLTETTKQEKDRQKQQSDKNDQQETDTNESGQGLGDTINELERRLKEFDLSQVSAGLTAPGANQLTAAGSFTGAELAGGDLAIQREMAKFNKETAKNTKDLLTLARNDNGGTFG